MSRALDGIVENSKLWSPADFGKYFQLWPVVLLATHTEQLISISRSLSEGKLGDSQENRKKILASNFLSLHICFLVFSVQKCRYAFLVGASAEVVIIKDKYFLLQTVF